MSIEPPLLAMPKRLALMNKFLLSFCFAISLQVQASPKDEAISSTQTQLLAMVEQALEGLDTEQLSTLTALLRKADIVAKDGTITTTYYKIWYYPTTANVQDSGYESITYRPDKDILRIIGAASVSAEGDVQWVDEKQQKHIDTDSYNAFSNAKELVVSYPGVSKGGVTIIAYETQRKLNQSNSFWSFRDYPQQLTDTLDYSLNVSWEQDLPLYVGNTSAALNCEASQFSLSCRGQNITAAESDDRVTYQDELGQVSVTNLGTWQDVKNIVRPGFENAVKSADSISPIVAKITASADGMEAKIAAVFDYVARDIRYVSMSEDGFDIVPHHVDHTLANKYGDCKDKTAVLLAMLEHIGIEAFPVLVATRRSRIEPLSMPSVGVFNHVVACFDYNGEQFCLDATNPYADWQQVISDIQGKVALNLVDDKPIFKLPDSQYRWQLAAETLVELHEDGGQTETQHLTFFSEYAAYLRGKLAGLGTDKAIAWLQERYDDVVDAGVLPDYQMSGVDTLSARLTTQSVTEFSPYFDPSKRINLNEADYWLQSELNEAILENEFYDVFYPGIQLTSAYTIRMPASWAVNRFPAKLELQHQYGELIREVEYNTQNEITEIRVMTQLSIPSRLLSVDEQPRFNALIEVFYEQLKMNFGHEDSVEVL
jgi:hypothetical protein